MSEGDIETLNSLYPKKSVNFCRKSIVIVPTEIESCPINDFEKIDYNLCFDRRIASQCKDYCNDFIRRTCVNNQGGYDRWNSYSRGNSADYQCGNCILKETTVTSDIEFKIK